MELEGMPSGHTCMHVPEIYPVTQMPFYEREEQVHVFKVMQCHSV